MTPPSPTETKYKPKYKINVQNKIERKLLKGLEVIRSRQMFKENFFLKKDKQILFYNLRIFEI